MPDAPGLMKAFRPCQRLSAAPAAQRDAGRLRSHDGGLSRRPAPAPIARWCCRGGSTTRKSSSRVRASSSSRSAAPDTRRSSSPPRCMLKPAYDWFYPVLSRPRALPRARHDAARDAARRRRRRRTIRLPAAARCRRTGATTQLNIVSQSSPTGTQCLQAIGCAEAGLALRAHHGNRGSRVAAFTRRGHLRLGRRRHDQRGRVLGIAEHRLHLQAARRSSSSRTTATRSRSRSRCRRPAATSRSWSSRFPASRRPERRRHRLLASYRHHARRHRLRAATPRARRSSTRTSSAPIRTRCRTTRSSTRRRTNARPRPRAIRS